MAREMNHPFCIDCGTVLPVAAKFCPQCGQTQKQGRQVADLATGSIHLKRRFALNNAAVPMNVYVDDQHVGSVKCGATATFPSVTGEHKVVVSIEKAKCDPLVIRLNAGQQIQFICGYEGFFSEANFL